MVTVCHELDYESSQNVFFVLLENLLLHSPTCFYQLVVCHKPLLHETGTKITPDTNKPPAVLSHHKGCQQKPPGETVAFYSEQRRQRRLMMRRHHQRGQGSALWRIFHLCGMWRYRLLSHPPPSFSSRPSQLLSLSLDMPSKLFHALSLQQRLRSPPPLSLCVSRQICPALPITFS